MRRASLLAGASVFALGLWAPGCLFHIAIVSLLVLADVGCGTARRGSPFLSETPVTDKVVRSGQIVFFRECNPCHPGGAEGLGPALNDKPLPERALETQVRQGFGEMPAFSPDEITDQELDALIAYLAWLRELEPRIADENP